MRSPSRVTIGLSALAIGLAITQLRAHDPSQFTFTVLAGTPPVVAPGFVDGPGLTAAKFNAPRGIVAVAGGAAIVADTVNHAIRHISAVQVVTTIAGSGSSGSQDGPLASATFYGPHGVAVHSDGTIYVADAGNHTVRRISTSGAVTTLAGTAGVEGHVDATGAAASFTNPSWIAVASDHTVYVTSALRIRAITSSGVVTTLAGSSTSGSSDGQGTAATFSALRGLALTPQNDLVAADNQRVRRISLTGNVTTLTSALAAGARAIAARATGEVLVSLTDERLVAISTAGVIAPVANGLPMAGLAAGTDGSVLATADTNSGHPGLIVRRAADSPTFVAWAGQAKSDYELDGQGRGARFSWPVAIARDSAGNLYVADRLGFRIRKISPSGFVTTLAPTVNFSNPEAVAVDANGYVYVAETGTHMIRRIAPDGTVAEWASTIGGGNGYVNGPGTQARFRSPGGLAVGGDGALYVADRFNCAIRRIATDRTVTTLAGGLADGGTAGQCANVDGAGTDARLGYVETIAAGPTGDLYVADSSNHTIRRVTMAGVVTTVAGTAGQAGHTDGSRQVARFRGPSGVAVASDGAIYVTDSASTVRQIAPDGTVTTVGGVALQYGSTEGTGSAARFSNPRSLLVDPQFNLYITDTNNHTIVKGAPDGLSAPAFTTAPASTSVASGGTAAFTVAASGVPAPTFTWEVSSNGGASYSALANGNGIAGATTAALTWTGVPLFANSYRIRAIATNVVGTATSTHALLMVTGATATPSSLRIGVQRGGGHIATESQRVVASYTGSGTPTWTASDDASWLSVDGSTTNGAQTGAFMVHLVSSAIDFTTAPDTMTATVTLSAANLGLTVQVPVTLRILPTGPMPVIGQVDTPAQNATGVQGAIGVTGWAVHPIGVNRVRVFRDCFAGETCTVAPEAGLGNNIIYIGDALFIPGARPDIEAAFPDYPASHIGGWGMQILTNQLPRTTGTFSPTGGQGPITLYVVATPRPSALGQTPNEARQLSRSWTDTVVVPTTITLDNDTIAKPFGTIDTPFSSATVSGTVANFGWALTPDSDTTAGSGDILIPTNGSSMTVFIDGVATATVAYNQCRGTVGNPVPAGTFCNDDVASIFGNTTPQAALGTRTSNPTRYRNLDAARGAIGAYNIDTTLLSNGLHTIAWSVTDSSGRVEGIGSRFFTVSNVSSDAASAKCGGLGAECAVATHAAVRRTSDDVIRGRTGFDLRRPWTTLHADDSGIRHVRIPVTNGRVELSLGAGIETAFLESNGEQRSLPAGASFDPATGSFTWAPGPGYLGTYRFGFGEVSVDITLNTPAPTPAGESEVKMFLDSAGVEGLVPSERTVRVEGWALDPQADIGSGIATVHVWASRVPGPGSWGPGAAAPVFLGEAALDVTRPDVAAAFGPAFGHAGFRLDSTTTLAPGDYEVTAYVWNWRTSRWEDARSARVTVR